MDDNNEENSEQSKSTQGSTKKEMLTTSIQEESLEYAKEIFMMKKYLKNHLMLEIGMNLSVRFARRNLIT